jgi:outer membrane protein assembly factor BamB
MGVGGVAATEDFVIVSSRDTADKSDWFEVLDAESGVPLFKLTYPAALQLDYGNSPRVTPVIHGSNLFCLGAQGHLHCVSLTSGEVLWKRHLVEDLGGTQPQWGYAVSPICIDDQIIFQPGGLEASWVSLSISTGDVVWRAKGRPAAYATPIVIEHRGLKQLIAYDSDSLGSWSVTDGHRLWEFKPPVPKDFNVPTPVIVNNRIFVVTENNSARLYSIVASPKDASLSLQLESSSDSLSDDSQSPVRIGNWVAGIDRDLVVLDPSNGLREVARFADASLQSYNTMIVDEDRVWVCTGRGTQLLLQVKTTGIIELGRFQAMEEAGEIYAHPAFCNGVLYVRGPTWLDAYSINGDNRN